MIYFLLSILMLFLIALSFLVYRSELKDSVKIITLPLAIILAGFLGYHYILSLGKPVEYEPTGEWEYIHHISYSDNIELWIFDEDNGSRLYIFPYNEEVRKKLEDAKEMQEKGQRVKGEFDKGIGSSNGDSILNIVNDVGTPIPKE